jgi:glycosyltransferase involved in cell wall biosynthesis
LLSPHSGTGRAEQVTALLARGLSHEKYELHLGLVAQQSPPPESAPPPPPDAAPPWVSVHPLGPSRLRIGACRVVRLVRQIKPDLILSSEAQLNFLVLLLRPFYPRRTRVLVRQNTTVSSALAFGGQPWYTRLLYRSLYPRADRVICQSHAMADDLCREVGIRRARIAVLPNPVNIEDARAPSRWAGSKPVQQADCVPGQWTGAGPHLLAVGALVPERGFDLLLDALAVVRRSFPQADLVIAGHGPEEAALRAHCGSLDLEAAVDFRGRVESPHALYPQASLFVLSSRSEGMPGALLEALAGSLPIVATPASGGVVDLLRGRPGTWLAREASSAALAAALLKALEEISPGQRFYRSLRSVS